MNSKLREAAKVVGSPSTSNEKIYLKMLDFVMKHGDSRNDRTGTGTISVFGAQSVYDLRNGFPILTTKFVPFKTLRIELDWFLKGLTNVRYLQERGCRIWDEWANENGDLGPVYGKMWREFPHPDGTTTDQISDVIRLLKIDPDTRRAIVSAWHPSLVPMVGSSTQENILNGLQALPPCHTMWQLHSSEIPAETMKEMVKKGIVGTPFLKRRLNDAEVNQVIRNRALPTRYLDLKLYQRSGDIFLGVPFNMASYALLQSAIAAYLNMIPRFFIHSFGDLHLYKNHFAQALEQLTREPLLAPTLALPDTEAVGSSDEVATWVDNYGIWKGWEEENAPILLNYNHHEAIRAPVAV